MLLCAVVGLNPLARDAFRCLVSCCRTAPSFAHYDCACSSIPFCLSGYTSHMKSGTHANLTDVDSKMWELDRCQNPECPLACSAATWAAFVAAGGHGSGDVGEWK